MYVMQALITDIAGKIGATEFKYYLDNYQNLGPQEFALIKISGECIKNNLENIVIDLSHLQNLGLSPIVVFGWGDILNANLGKKGIRTEFTESGDRVTTPEILEEITEVVDSISESFLALSKKYALQLNDLTKEKIFYAKKLAAEPNQRDAGLVGEIKSINPDLILNACHNKKIPLIAPLGFDSHGMYNLNGDTAAVALAKLIKPLKFISLTKTGGVLDFEKKLIKKISIIDDYESLVKEGIISGGMLKKVNEAKELLEFVKNGYSVQIVSPENLLAELFTYYGTGTKIILGYNVYVHQGFNGLDKQKVKDLIESSINKTLVGYYFEKTVTKKVILGEDYDGIGISLDFSGWDYLDKFMVSGKIRGNGMGNKIFSEFLKSGPEKDPQTGYFWRADPKNNHLPFYLSKIREFNGGCHFTDNWIVFWIGGNPNCIPQLIDYAVKKENTLELAQNGK